MFAVCRAYAAIVGCRMHRAYLVYLHALPPPHATLPPRWNFCRCTAVVLLPFTVPHCSACVPHPAAAFGRAFGSDLFGSFSVLVRWTRRTISPAHTPCAPTQIFPLPRLFALRAARASRAFTASRSFAQYWIVCGFTYRTVAPHVGAVVGYTLRCCVGHPARSFCCRVLRVNVALPLRAFRCAPAAEIFVVRVVRFMRVPLPSAAYPTRVNRSRLRCVECLRLRIYVCASGACVARRCRVAAVPPFAFCRRRFSFALSFTFGCCVVPLLINLSVARAFLCAVCVFSFALRCALCVARAFDRTRAARCARRYV